MAIVWGSLTGRFRTIGCRTSRGWRFHANENAPKMTHKTRWLKLKQTKNPIAAFKFQSQSIIFLQFNYN